MGEYWLAEGDWVQVTTRKTKDQNYKLKITNTKLQKPNYKNQNAKTKDQRLKSQIANTKLQTNYKY